jgi:transcriptional regulator with XRE-family HTH domain
MVTRLPPLVPELSATGNCSPKEGDIGPKHLGKIERGEKAPSFELIIALARELNASPSTFRHFENANADPMFLTPQLQSLCAKRDAKQLRKAYRFLQATLYPLKDAHSSTLA